MEIDRREELLRELLVLGHAHHLGVEVLGAVGEVVRADQDDAAVDDGALRVQRVRPLVLADVDARAREAPPVLEIRRPAAARRPSTAASSSRSARTRPPSASSRAARGAFFDGMRYGDSMTMEVFAFRMASPRRTADARAVVDGVVPEVDGVHALRALGPVAPRVQLHEVAAAAPRRASARRSASLLSRRALSTRRRARSTRRSRSDGRRPRRTRLRRRRRGRRSSSSSPSRSTPRRDCVRR